MQVSPSCCFGSSSRPFKTSRKCQTVILVDQSRSLYQSPSLQTQISPLLQTLSHFLGAWSQITSDQCVLSAVEVVCTFQLVSIPLSPFPFRDRSHKELFQEVQSLLPWGPWRTSTVSQRGGVLVPLFAFGIRKGMGEQVLRPILVLCLLNKLFKVMVLHGYLSFCCPHNSGRRLVCYPQL